MHDVGEGLGGVRRRLVVAAHGVDDLGRERPALAEERAELGVVGAEGLALVGEERPGVGCGGDPLEGVGAGDGVDRELADVAEERGDEGDLAVHAVDLRELVGSIHIAGDLERAGDLAKNIAKRVMKVASDARQPRAIVGLKHMGELAATQLKEVLDAYAQRDVERARAVWLRDAEIDALEDSVFRDLLTFMMEDPRNITFCTHLLFCSKNLERVGDHATNIAETIQYISTGVAMPMDRPKGA